MLQYRANKCVFKSLRKLSLVTLGSLKVSGNEFQADRPATEIEPYVCNQWCGRTRSCQLADLRCCREATSETGRQRSTKYWGAWPCRQLCTMMQSLYVTRSGTLSQCSSVCSNRNKPRSNLCVPVITRASIHHLLKLDSRHFRRIRQKSITVVDAWRHEWMDECRCWLRVEWTPTTPQRRVDQG